MSKLNPVLREHYIKTGRLVATGIIVMLFFALVYAAMVGVLLTIHMVMVSVIPVLLIGISRFSYIAVIVSREIPIDTATCKNTI